jgi:hypothetical protein
MLQAKGLHGRLAVDCYRVVGSINRWILSDERFGFSGQGIAYVFSMTVE